MSKQHSKFICSIFAFFVSSTIFADVKFDTTRFDDENYIAIQHKRMYETPLVLVRLINQARSPVGWGILAWSDRVANGVYGGSGMQSGLIISKNTPALLPIRFDESGDLYDIDTGLQIGTASQASNTSLYSVTSLCSKEFAHVCDVEAVVGESIGTSTINLRPLDLVHPKLIAFSLDTQRRDFEIRLDKPVDSISIEFEHSSVIGTHKFECSDIRTCEFPEQYYQAGTIKFNRLTLKVPFRNGRNYTHNIVRFLDTNEIGSFPAVYIQD